MSRQHGSVCKGSDCGLLSLHSLAWKHYQNFIPSGVTVSLLKTFWLFDLGAAFILLSNEHIIATHLWGLEIEPRTLYTPLHHRAILPAHKGNVLVLLNLIMNTVLWK